MSADREAAEISIRVDDNNRIQLTHRLRRELAVEVWDSQRGAYRWIRVAAGVETDVSPGKEAR